MDSESLNHSTLRIEDLVKQTRERLLGKEDCDQDCAHLETDILLAYCLEKPRSYLRAWPEKVVTEEQQARLQDLVQRRLEGEPIAYLIGNKEFWDIKLYVTPDTLIPRPETEHVVEHALKLLKPHHTSRVADLGCGCGAIGLAIAKHRPGCHITATDISEQALAVARLNQRQLGLQNIDFYQGSWFAALYNKRFNLIVSNPPYVAEDDPHLQQGDVRFEPLQALIGGPDGLDCIREIINRAPQHLLPGGWLMLEHGYDQSATVKQMMLNAGAEDVWCHTDLSRQERLTMGHWT